MDLSSSYIDEVDNSLEFELVEDDHEEEEERTEVKAEEVEHKQAESPLRQSAPLDGSPMSYSLLELPDPEDNILNMLTCSSCLGKMDTIVMLVTASGVCEHNFCEDCVSRCQELAQENDQTFRCPTCNKEVITVGENRQAMELAKRIMEMQANPQHLKDLEKENQTLHEQIQQQQQEHERLLLKQRQSQAELSHTLTNEREERAVLEKRMEEILRSHEDFKQHSGQMTRTLQQQIQETKQASADQVLSLEKERQNLLQLKEKERESASETMVELQKKIYRMEKSLQSNQALQRSLERSCQRTISELQQRETEVERVREQMKKQSAQRTRSTPETLIESVSQGMASLLWSSSDGIGATIRTSSSGATLNLIQPLDRYDLREIRGDRKEGRVRKAIIKSSGETVALKLVTFDPSVLPDNSVLGTLSRFSWYSKSEEQLEKERVRLSEEEVAAFREAMLLFKLNSESIISLEGIVQTSEPGRFYMQLPYLNFDLHYALETRGDALTEKEIRSMIYQILLGLYYLHSGNIVHRSLSASNILTSDMQRVYITGFSYAISLNSPTPFPPIPSRNLNYVAPELLYMSSEQQSSEAWKAIDMWSVGTIIALLLRRESLFAPTSQKVQCLNSILSVEECLPSESVRVELSNFYFPLKRALSATEGSRVSLRSHFPSEVSDDAVDLVRSLLTFDGAQRLTAADALRHPYFHSVSSSFVPLSCTVGFECTDSDIHGFVEQYCSPVFA